MAIFKGIDGTHLLAIENEEGFIKLGWSRDSKKLKYLLKDLQVLQTEDMVWKINNLNLKLKWNAVRENANKKKDVLHSSTKIEQACGLSG